MQYYHAGDYDAAVIGAGHAGIEAALALARLGLRTVLFTLNMDAVGNMPCNPSIGGTAKGHLVHEIDALGGEMGLAADETFIQSRMLNRGKGPAVHSLRAQIDRRAYQMRMKRVLERTENLSLRQGEVTALELDCGGNVCAALTRTGGRYAVRAAVIATGTYLNGRVIIGEAVYESGPDGMQAASRLADWLAGQGLALRRFKTGTPGADSETQRGFFQNGSAEGRRAGHALFVLERADARQSCGLPPDLYQCAHARRYIGKPAPFAVVFRRYRGRGAALLPKH